MTLVTTGERWNKHVYPDVDAWSPTLPLIVYASGYDDIKQPAQICLAWQAGSEWRSFPLANDGWFNRHTGCFQTWAPDNSGIYYHSSESRGTNFLRFGVLEPIEIGPLHRHISPDGRHLVYREFGQRPWNKKFSGNDLCVMDVESFDSARVMISYDALEAASGPNATPAYTDNVLTFTNTIWSPDGMKMLLSNSWGELFCAVSDCPYCGSFALIPLGKAGHRSWHPDSERIVFASGAPGQLGLHEIRYDGTGHRLITDDRSCYGSPGSHPVYSPDGQWIVGESYVPDAFAIWLTNAETGDGFKLVDVGTTYGVAKPDGTHMHPIWSPDGTQILYDSDATGTCQMYLTEVPQ